MRFVQSCAPVVALMCLVCVPQAFAETVSFTTAGQFNTSSPGTPAGTSPASHTFKDGGGNNLATVTFTGGGATLTDLNVGDIVSLNTFAGESFGSFAVQFYGVSGTPKTVVTVPFELTILQSAPSIGQGYAPATVKGTINVGDINGSFQALFDFDSIVSIGQVDYQVMSTIVTATGSATPTSLGGQVTVNPTVVPVPAAVWGGVSLLGLLRGGRVWQRRRQLA